MQDVLMNDNKNGWKMLRAMPSAVEATVGVGLFDDYPPKVVKLPQISSILILSGYADGTLVAGTTFTFNILGFRENSKFAERIAVITAKVSTVAITKKIDNEKEPYSGLVLSEFAVVTDFISSESGASIDVTLNQSASVPGFLLLDTRGISSIFIEKTAGVGEVALVFTSTTR